MPATTLRWCSAAFALVAALATASIATAADVAVHYLAERKPVRSAAPTSLVTIELHGDAACTAPIAAATATIRDLDAVADVERVKLRGAPAAPRIVELRHVVHGVAAVGALYARVAGEGIAPAGGGCQLQAVAAPPAAAWPLVRDAAGQTMGAVAIIGHDGLNGVLSDDGHGAYAIGFGRYAVGALDYQILFATEDCTGTPYVVTGYLPFVGSASVDHVIYVPSAPPAATSLGSWYEDRCYHLDPEPFVAAPAVPFDAGRFVQPYQIELGGAP